MAGDGTTYDIDIKTNAAGVESAATACARLAESLTGASSAAEQAAAAVKAGEAAYKAAETGADKAAKALEKIGIAAQGASGAKLQNLLARQAEAAQRAQAASAAMHGEAAALDKLKASAAGATAAHANISKALDKAKLAADAAKKAAAAAAGSGKVNEMGEAFGKLGGPIGTAGQKLFGAAEGFKKMQGSLGSTTGLLAAGAVGITAIAAAVLAVSAAAVVGIGSITLWAVKLADTEGKLGKLGERVKKNFTKLFSGLNIKPLLGELEKIADLFDEGTASANAIKVVFNSLFQPVVDGITSFVPKMIAAFIQFDILVLKALIAIKPWGGALEAIGIGFLALAAIIVAIGAIVVVGALAMVGAFGALLALPFVVKEGFDSVFGWLKSLSLSEIGTNIIKGLVDGLLLGGPQVLSAITGVVNGAIDGAKKLLKIASPSQVFAEIGQFTGEGMAKGVDASSGDVQGSLESMVTPPEAATGTAAASKGSSGATYQITIQAAGSDGESIAEALRRVLADLGAQAGTAVPSV